MKKKLFAILLCLVMVGGVLPTVALAEDNPREPVVQFTIVKKVVKDEKAATPTAETFKFVLEDTADDKKALEDYGITLLDDLEIATDGENVYEKTINAKIDLGKVFNPDNGWNPIISIGTGTTSSYTKTFHITELDEGKEGWEYSTAGYAVTFKYDCDDQRMLCILHDRGGDATWNAAEFENTYTKAPAVPQSPKTGDNSSIGLWIALLLIGCATIVGTTVYSRKRKSIR